MSSPTSFKVSSQLLTALVQYLATKPYFEVVELINAIQQAEPIHASESTLPAVPGPVQDPE